MRLFALAALSVSSALSGVSEPLPEECDASSLLQLSVVREHGNMIRQLDEEKGGQETTLVSSKVTPFATLEVRQAPNGHKWFYLNNATQSSTEDAQKYHELLVQPSLAYLQHNSSVLVIGGGEGATLREVLTSPKVSEVIMVDLDGELVQFVKEHLPEMHRGAFDSPKATVLIEEGAQYLRDQDEAFDAIVVDGTDIMDHVPDAIDHMPDFGGLLFSQQFYDSAFAALRPGGSFVQYASSASPWPLMKGAGFVSLTGYEISVDSLDGGGAIFAYGRKPVKAVEAAEVAETMDPFVELPSAISHMQTSQAFKYLSPQTMQQALSEWMATPPPRERVQPDRARRVQPDMMPKGRRKKPKSLLQHPEDMQNLR